MPLALVWTPLRDERIRHLRLHGESWSAIAMAIGVSRNAVLERGRHIGALRPASENKPGEASSCATVPDAVPDPSDTARPTFPAGHPATWGAITDRTLLAGTPYPAWTPERRALRGRESHTPVRATIISHPQEEAP